MKRFILCLTILIFLIGIVGEAQALIIGTSDGVGNAFPFGYFGTGSEASNSRYQQVYDSISFLSTMTICEIVFFRLDSNAGNINSGV